MMESPTRPKEPVVLVAQTFPEQLKNGLAEIARYCPHANFVVDVPTYDSRKRIGVQFGYQESLPDRSYNIHVDNSTASPQIINIMYKRHIDAFRAIGQVLASVFSLDSRQLYSINMAETAVFETAGVMVDCSRGAVLRVQTVCKLLRQCALFGLNTFQLYTEDTYTIPNEPFFGFNRGGYTPSELSFICDYASYFGIEVFPCIQTLGHLGQVLQWPAYSHLKDTNEVLLADSEPTYEFIEKMIESASKPFTSKRIHIGMDEATGVGEGVHHQMYPSKAPRDTFLDHLQRVNGICQAKGLQPLIWSDMLFTLASENDGSQGYYDEAGLPRSIARGMPADVQLVYWDYYHTQEDVYLRKIDQHREAGFDPWVAGGVWTWNRFFTALPFTFDTLRACLTACKKKAVRNVFVTIWGDDGNECDILTALPGLAYFGAHAYTSDYEVDWSKVRNMFAAISGGRLDDFMYASKIDSVPTIVERRYKVPPNPSKFILWQDPIYNFLTAQYAQYDLAEHFEDISKYLETATSDEMVAKYPLNKRLTHVLLLTKVLILKCNFRIHLEAAYRSMDRVSDLNFLVQSILMPLREALDQLWRYHRDQVWLQTYKPFGLEILELRYGAIKTRLASLQERIEQITTKPKNEMEQDDDEDEIGFPELETDVLSNQPFPSLGMDLLFDFSRAYTPSRALGSG